MTDFKELEKLALNDVATLKEKGRTYGDSWKKRGGVGAFMMAARKWDRIENICGGACYDIFVVGGENRGGILDDIADLRAYLLLIEEYVRAPQCGDGVPKHVGEGPAKTHYDELDSYGPSA